jgi:F0F1-type ATP synthase assembly protein I
MPLSEYEQRVLEQMEQQLRSDDPKLARTIGSGGGPRRPMQVVVGGLVVAAGLGMLLGGVAASLVPLGIVGFVAMFVGVLLMLRRTDGPENRTSTGAGPSNVHPMPTRGSSSFMQRIEERWDRRRRDR